MRTATLLGSLVFAVCSHGAAPPSRDLWWRAAWPFRRTIAMGSEEAGYAAVRFVTFGRTRADGADLRVIVDDRTEIPHALLDWGRDHSALLSFPVRDPKRTYRIYFGNVTIDPPGRAKAPEPLLERRDAPPAGLFCEVRRLGRGNGDDWAAMQALIAASDEVLGCDRMDRCALGLNPFGDGGGYLVIWHGVLRFDRPGPWRFATNSNGPSFVLVGGEVVASWPGWHGAAGGEQGEHDGEVSVRSRAARFTYVYAARDGDNGHICGIAGGGDPALRPLTARDCVPLLPASAGPLEDLLSEDVLDFEWQPAGDTGLSGRDVCRLRFTDRSAPAGQRIQAWKWRFGDGQSASGRITEHVYLARGNYDVELEISVAGGTVLRTGARVAVNPRGEGHPAAEDIAGATLSYDLEPLSLAALENLLFFRWEDGREELRHFFPAARAFFARRPPLGDRARERWAEALLERLFLSDDGEAVKLAEYVFSAAAEPELRARAARVAGATYRHVLGDTASAERLWRRALRDDGGRTLPPSARREFTLLAGEAARRRGEAAEAASLRAAAARLEPGRTAGELARGEGSYLVRHHVREGEYGRAWDALDAWLTTEPVALDTGEIAYFRAEILAAAGRSAAALGELEYLLAREDGVGRSTRRKECLELAGRLYERTGRPDEAKRLEALLEKEFPAPEPARPLDGHQ